MIDTWRLLADQLLDAVFLVAEDGRIQYINPACTAIFGYQPEEMIGRTILELIHPDDLDRTIAEMARVVGGRPSIGFENRYLRKDGSVVHIMWTARWSPEEKLRIGVARDISERKMAEQRQAAIRLHTAASIGIALYPEHGDEPDHLMRYADQAMYACKAAHKAEMKAGAGVFVVCSDTP